jgi:hypothetical protein
MKVRSNLNRTITGVGDVKRPRFEPGIRVEPRRLGRSDDFAGDHGWSAAESGTENDAGGSGAICRKDSAFFMG